MSKLSGSGNMSRFKSKSSFKFIGQKGGQFPDLTQSPMVNAEIVDELHYADLDSVKTISGQYRKKALDTIIKKSDETKILFRVVAEQYVGFNINTLYHVFENGDFLRADVDRPGYNKDNFHYIPFKHLYSTLNSGLLSTTPRIFDALRYMYHYYFNNHPKEITGKVWLYIIQTKRGFNVTDIDNNIRPNHINFPIDKNGQFSEYDVVGYIKSSEILGAFELDNFKLGNYKINYLENPYCPTKLSEHEINGYRFNINMLRDKFTSK